MTTPLQRVIQTEASGGIILLLSAIGPAGRASVLRSRRARPGPAKAPGASKILHSSTHNRFTIVAAGITLSAIGARSSRRHRRAQTALSEVLSSTKPRDGQGFEGQRVARTGDVQVDRQRRVWPHLRQPPRNAGAGQPWRLALRLDAGKSGGSGVRLRE
jgi:hypothetical protein